MRTRALHCLGISVLAACLPLHAANGGNAPQRLGGHEVRRDASGHLLPWIDWNTALDREMRFYATAPLDHGYPIFVTTTFLDGDWKPTARDDTIPATQNALGILSYLKFRAWRGKRDARALAIARAMGDYLLDQDLTSDGGAYPRFPHSTGRRANFPQPPDSGSQSDRAYEIEPDKGALAGYALLRLHAATGEKKYLAAARHIAQVLANNQVDGDASHSPWPFRVDTRNGAARGPVAGNMVFALRLYDALIARGENRFKAERDSLWRWIKHEQIPSAAGDGALFAQFFEDHDNPANRTAWAPLNLARYLLEQRDALDADWRVDAQTLIDFVRRDFTHIEFGVRVCHEQDEDHDAWGGVNSTYGAVLALYAKATGSAPLAQEARAALNFALYAIDERGRPRDLPTHAELGGWQEDAHTDVIHNVVDALEAFPQWADAAR